MINKKIIYMLITGILIISICSSLAIASNSQFTVHGYITNYSSIKENGLPVRITNINNGESLQTTTYGESNPGKYQVNLGNMATQWAAGDLIQVSVSYTQGVYQYSGATSFNIPTGTTIYQKDMTISIRTSATGAEGASDAEGLFAFIDEFIALLSTELIVVISMVIIAVIILFSASKTKSTRKRTTKHGDYSHHRHPIHEVKQKSRSNEKNSYRFDFDNPF